MNASDSSHHEPSRIAAHVWTLGIGRDRDYLIENLSMLVASGMTVSEALEGVVSELRSKRARQLAGGIVNDIEAGFPLSRALEQAGIFPAHTISLVRIGEESGKLAQNLRMIAEQQKKERVLRSRIRSAAMYPVFVLGLTLIIGVGIAWFILPKLATVFSQLKIALPLITKILIKAGAFLGAWGHIAIPAFLIVVVSIIYMLFFAQRTKHIGQSFIFAIPAIRLLLLETELTRFGYLLGTLLSAGLPVVQAIGSLRDATDFPAYRRFYTFLAEHIEQGDSFAKSFKTYQRLDRLIPASIQQLIVSAERSGNLSNILLEISKTYEERSETTTKNLSIILEPILLVIVWLGVVAVAVAVILPIYSLVGNFSTS